jgi:hypothetical protein
MTIHHIRTGRIVVNAHGCVYLPSNSDRRFEASTPSRMRRLLKREEIREAEEVSCKCQLLRDEDEKGKR